MMKFNVIEGQGKVVAVLTDCEDDIIGKIYKRTGILLQNDKLKLRKTYKGVSKCHPDDVFDLKEGKRLAKERLLVKYNRAYNKALDEAGDMISKLDEVLDDIEYR